LYGGDLDSIQPKDLHVAFERSGFSMKRLLSLAAAGLMCGAAVVGASGVAGASSVPSHGALHVGRMTVQPGGLINRVSGFGSSSPTVSENWSGYGALSPQKFNYVHATFVQPTVTCPGIANQYTSNWVGIDGYNDQTVEQDGTFGFCAGKGNTTPKYVAWYEMYPASSALEFSVKPGDIIDTSVTYANGQFTTAVSDLTSGKSFSVSSKIANAQRSSAEWIIERPALCNNAGTKCFLAELANYKSTAMSGATASVDGGAVKNVGGFHNIPIYMIDPINRGFVSLDTVGPLSGPSFGATWDRHGTTTPITLNPKG
jgi:hypothetical protein